MKYFALGFTMVSLLGFTAFSSKLSFTLRNDYRTHHSGSRIFRHIQAGDVLRFLDLNLNSSDASSLRGIAYGGKGLMYDVMEQWKNESVLALGETGTLDQTYQQTGRALGNVLYGHRAFGNQRPFHVSQGTGASQFTIGGVWPANPMSLASGSDPFGMKTDGTTDIDFTDPFKGDEPVPVTQTTSVPLPGAFWLMGSGIIGLLCVARKRT
jgi:hypothetical protein